MGKIKHPTIVNLLPHEVNLFRFTFANSRSDFMLLAKWEAAEKPLRAEERDLKHYGSWLETGALSRGQWFEDHGDEGNYPARAWIAAREFTPPELPPEGEGTLYIVSLPLLMILAMWREDRRDLIAPDTGPGPFGAVRDDHGRIMGCRRFITLKRPPAWLEAGVLDPETFARDFDPANEPWLGDTVTITDGVAHP